MKPEACKMDNWLLLTALSLVLALVSPGIVLALDPPSPPHMPAEAAVESADTGMKDRDYFTDLTLVTHEGKEVRFFSDLLQDRIVLITGFYVNCDTTSPRQNLMLSRVQKQLGELLGQQVWIVTLTVDPIRDTPDLVSDYAKVFAPQPGWTFVTGSVENIDWVNYRLGQYTVDPETHPGVYLLGNLKTGLWLKVPSNAKPDELLSRIKQVLYDTGSNSS